MSQQPSSTEGEKTLSNVHLARDESSLFSQNSRGIPSDRGDRDIHFTDVARQQESHGVPGFQSFDELVFALQSLEEGEREPPSHVDEGSLFGRAEEQESLHLMKINQLSEHPSVLHHSESYPGANPTYHTPVGAGGTSITAPPTPAPRPSLRSRQTLSNDQTLSDNTLAQSSAQPCTQIETSQRNVPTLRPINKTPAYNQADQFNAMINNQTPAWQANQHERPPTMQNLNTPPTNRPPSHRPPTHNTGAQSLRIDLGAAAAVTQQRNVPSTASPGRLAHSTSPADQPPRFRSLPQSQPVNPVLNRDQEEEALKKFKIYFARAEIKAKDSKKADEAYQDYSMALIFEKEVRGENSLEVAKTHRIMARLCTNNDKSNEAVLHLKQAIDIYRISGGADHDTDGWWRLHDELAQVYGKLGQSQLEIGHYEEAISILNKATDIPPERLVHMHYNVGVELSRCGDDMERAENLERAKYHLTKARDMHMLLGEETEDLAKTCNVLGNVYKKQGRLDEARAEFENYIRIQNKISPGGRGRLLSAPVHSELADVYDKLGRSEEAQTHRSMSNSILTNIGADNNEGQQLQHSLQAMAEAAGMGGLLDAGMTSQGDIQRGQDFQREGNHQSAIQSYETAIQKINSLPENLRNTDEIFTQLASVHNNTGNSYRSIGRLQEAKTHIEKSLELRRRLYGAEPTEEIATSLYNLGFLLAQLGGDGNIIQAIEVHGEAAQIYERLGGPQKDREYLKWMIDIHQSLGLRYSKLNGLAKSLEHYEKAKQLIHEFDGSHKELQSICNNAGNAYQKNRQYKEAEENFEISIALAGMLCAESPHDPELQNHLASVENNLGCLYQSTSQYNKALQHHQNCLEIRRRIADVYAEAQTDLPGNLHNIGNTYKNLRRYTEAIDYCQQALEAKRNLGEDVTDILVSLSQAYAASGDSVMAEAILNQAG